MIEAAVPDPEVAQLAVMRKRAGDLLASGVLEDSQQLICKEMINTEVEEMKAYMQSRALVAQPAGLPAGTGMGTDGTQLAAGGGSGTAYTYNRVYCVNTNAGLETYPYSPRLVRVNTTIAIRAW
jgi:hypothetical protein